MEQRLNDDLEAFQDALLGWAAVRLRELPWRATRDPWGILVSEVMLQQTGVSRVMLRSDACSHATAAAVATAAAAPPPLPAAAPLLHAGRSHRAGATPLQHWQQERPC